MPAVNAFQTNFTAGEISPLLFARVDVAKYTNAAQKIENMIVQRYGGARKRGGTEYINGVKTNSTKVRLIPFIFSVTQAYILEFGDNYIRVYADGGRVGTVEVTSPYGEADLFDLQFAQSADVLYIAHPDYAPREFTRTGATTFTISEVEFEDGPYLPLNTTSTTLTPAGTANAVSKMTSNTAPSPFVASNSAGSANAYLVFDRDKVLLASAGNAADTGTSGYVRIDRGSGNSVVVDAYWLVAPSNQAQYGSMFTQWTFEGSNDGSTWTVLDSRDNETGWASTETRFYEFPNKTEFRYYQVKFSGGGGATSNNTTVAEVGLHLGVDNQSAFNLTASSITGINDDTGFQTTDVGRHIRLLGGDGVWRWAKIAARTSTTVVTVKLYGHALPDTSAILNWQLGAWSDETGWPASVGFFEGRLCFARTNEQPQTVWMSKTDDFTDFGESDPLLDTDAINATISSESVNEVQWIAESTDLFVGTTAAIRTIGPNTSTGGFSPTNIRQKRETTFGASKVRPARVGNVGIYSGYYRKDIREIAYSFESDGYVSQDLSILAEHITGEGVKEMAYQQTPDSVIWFVDDAGGLSSMTYERDQDVVAFQRHILGGTDVVVESVATIPGTGGDEVWLLVKRTINSGTVRYIERLSVGLADDGNIEDGTFLDSYLQYSGASTTTITGLGHLEGESVYTYGAEGKQGPYTVTSGSITIGSAVTAATVGLAYSSKVDTLSPEAAARGGTAQAREGRISEVWLRLNRSQGGSVYPINENDDIGTAESIEYDDGTLFSGDKRVPIAMEWNRRKRVRVQHDDPTPFHLLGMIAELRVSG